MEDAVDALAIARDRLDDRSGVSRVGQIHLPVLRRETALLGGQPRELIQHSLLPGTERCPAGQNDSGSGRVTQDLLREQRAQAAQAAGDEIDAVVFEGQQGGIPRGNLLPT
jgi:hypothetical protein